MIDPFVFQLAVLSLLGLILSFVLLSGREREEQIGGLVFLGACVPFVWMLIELERLAS